MQFPIDFGWIFLRFGMDFSSILDGFFLDFSSIVDGIFYGFSIFCSIDVGLFLPINIILIF